MKLKEEIDNQLLLKCNYSNLMIIVLLILI